MPIMDCRLLALTVLATISVALAYQDVDGSEWTYLGNEAQPIDDENDCCPYSRYPSGTCCPQPCCQSITPSTTYTPKKVTCCSKAKAPVNPADQDIRTSIEVKLEKPWNANYANIGSTEAKALKAVLENAIKRLYATDTTFKGATVQSFKKGSTIAIILMVNKATSTAPLHYIEAAITTGQIAGIKVAKTLKVLEVVTPPGVGLTIQRRQPASQAYYASTPLAAVINVDSSTKFRLKFEQVQTATTTSATQAALAAKAAAAKAATAKAAAAKAAAVQAALKAAAIKKAVSKTTAKKPTTTTTGKKAKTFSDELFEVHNVARRIHGAKEFRKLDVILSAGATKWASYLAHLIQKGYRLRHSYSAMRRHNPLGENIAYTCKPFGQRIRGLDVGKMWYSEAKHFFKWWRNNQYFGHSVASTKRFLQMVWKGSRSIGIGVKTFQKKTAAGLQNCILVVTRYYPAAKFYRSYVNQNISKGKFTGAKREDIPKFTDEVEKELENSVLVEDKSIR